MSITNYLQQILSARYGRDVRQAIHDAIEETYEDATAEGNANAEVSAARGIYENLNARLNGIDSTIEDDEDSIAANADSITALGNRVTTLEGIGAWGNMIFNTYTGASANWAKCDYTKVIGQGNVLLFCVKDLENGHYYTATFVYYNSGVFSVQYFAPTKSIMVEFNSTSYCQVKLDGFTSGGGVYRIIVLL